VRAPCAPCATELELHSRAPTEPLIARIPSSSILVKLRALVSTACGSDSVVYFALSTCLRPCAHRRVYVVRCLPLDDATNPLHAANPLLHKLGVTSLSLKAVLVNPHVVPQHGMLGYAGHSYPNVGVFKQAPTAASCARSVHVPMWRAF